MNYGIRVHVLGETTLSIYMGFRLKINGVQWYFKDPGQKRLWNPNYFKKIHDATLRLLDRS